MTNVSCVYITSKDKTEALRIARILVEERLAACANVFNNSTSVYWWQGTIQEETEVGLIVKTTHDLVERIVSRVKELHSYSCPGIVSWRVEAGNPPYLQWVGEEVASGATVSV